MARRRILALGGHDFDRRAGNDAICDLIVELAESPRPRICLLPTASGDPEDQIARFRRTFAERDCVPQVISLFRLGEDPIDLREELLAQDVIYAGGGSMLNLVAIWRAHGLDEILRECWREGILVCGQSAGAMVWFEGGITSSQGRARRRRRARPAAGQRLRPLPHRARQAPTIPARDRLRRARARPRPRGSDRRALRGHGAHRDRQRARRRRRLGGDRGERGRPRGRAPIASPGGQPSSDQRHAGRDPRAATDPR